MTGWVECAPKVMVVEEARRAETKTGLQMTRSEREIKQSDETEPRRYRNAWLSNFSVIGRTDRGGVVGQFARTPMTHRRMSQQVTSAMVRVDGAR